MFEMLMAEMSPLNCLYLLIRLRYQRFSALVNRTKQDVGIKDSVLNQLKDNYCMGDAVCMLYLRKSPFQPAAR